MLDTFSFEAGIANELGIAVSREEMGQRPRQEHLGYVIEEGKRQGILPTGFTLTDARRYIEVFRLNLTAFLRYRPRPSGVRSVIFEDSPGQGPASVNLYSYPGGEPVSFRYVVCVPPSL